MLTTELEQSLLVVRRIEQLSEHDFLLELVETQLHEVLVVRKDDFALCNIYVAVYLCALFITWY